MEGLDALSDTAIGTGLPVSIQRLISPDVLVVPLAYASAHGNEKLIDFMNLWIELKKHDQTITSMYDYWILGRDVVPKQPRWSVLRNVLQWVE